MNGQQVSLHDLFDLSDDDDMTFMNDLFSPKNQDERTIESDISVDSVSDRTCKNILLNSLTSFDSTGQDNCYDKFTLAFSFNSYVTKIPANDIITRENTKFNVKITEYFTSLSYKPLLKYSGYEPEKNKYDDGKSITYGSIALTHDPRRSDLNDD